MKTISFDFSSIQNLPDFYKFFQKKFNLEPSVANNLDAVWDSITGIIELPIHIKFDHLSLEKLEKFQNLISLFEEAEEETNNELVFSCFLSK